MAEQTQGGGGNVFIVISVLVLGYLYFTRRLGAIGRAIVNPPMDMSFIGPPSPAQLPGGGPPTANQGQLSFTIYPPLGYSFTPIPVVVDRANCANLVYQLMLQATGSASQAQLASVQYCFGGQVGP